MLLPERVKALLGHEDRYIRRAAARYFTEARSGDPEVLPLILDAAERFDDAYSLAWCDRIAVPGPALDRVLDRLGRTDDEEMIERYNRLIVAAPGDVLAPRRAAVLGHPKLQADSIRAVELRCDFDAATGATLWDDLQRCCREADAAPDLEGVDFTRMHALVDALARRDVPDDATVIRLVKELEPEEGWLEVALVELAGRRRLGGALPNLIEKYQYFDADFLIEATSDAIARINDPEAARLIRRRYRDESVDWRIAVGWHLGHIKHPDVEAIVLDLLEAEPDEAARTLLCAALCDLFSERGIPAVEREIARGYDTTIDRLEDNLLVVADAHGLPLTHADAWREDRIQEEARRAKRQAEWERSQQRAERLRSRGIDPTDRSFPAAGPLAVVATPGSAPTPGPVRHPVERVGRNDPCPCGSGKKFKKCCGKSSGG